MKSRHRVVQRRIAVVGGLAGLPERLPVYSASFGNMPMLDL
jgi:hypothetical protein